jgi:hypothetical protein
MLGGLPLSNDHTTTDNTPVQTVSSNNSLGTEQSIVRLIPPSIRSVDIPGAPSVKLQTLDIARHVAISPNEKRYVVATYDDSHMGRGYVTAIFPQQNGYLTLVRLPLHEFLSSNPEDALERHIAVVQAIQRGQLNDYVKSQAQ